VVDATSITAPNSIKSTTGKRDAEMRLATKDNQWHHRKTAYIDADADSEQVHALVGTAANVNDETRPNALENGNEADVYA
jgi:IS5 family transposase